MRLPLAGPAALLPGLLLLLPLAAPGETAVQDDFSQTGQRTVGDRLDRTELPTHNATWAATANLTLVQEGEAWNVAPSRDILFLAKIRVPGPGDVVRLEASVRPVRADDAPRPGFITIGLGNPTPANINWRGGIYLILEPGGRAQLAIHLPGPDPTADANKEPTVVLTGKAIASFRPGGMNRAVLEYDRAANTVSAWVNDEPVGEKLPLAPHSFTPDIAAAGFSGYLQKAGEPAVSGFSLTLK